MSEISNALWATIMCTRCSELEYRAPLPCVLRSSTILNAYSSWKCLGMYTMQAAFVRCALDYPMCQNQVQNPNKKSSAIGITWILPFLKPEMLVSKAIISTMTLPPSIYKSKWSSWMCRPAACTNLSHTSLMICKSRKPEDVFTSLKK